MAMAMDGKGCYKYFDLKSSTSLFYSKENVGANSIQGKSWEPHMNNK